MTLVVLASASPSRLGLLRDGGIEPIVRVSDVDEDAIIARLKDHDPQDIVKALAQAKAEAVALQHLEFSPADTAAATVYPQCASQPDIQGTYLVVGCDSMLLRDGLLEGKPHTPQRARQRWQLLRGKNAELLTGHCVCEVTVIDNQPTISRMVSRTRQATVRFGNPTDADLEAYIATGESLQCAGAFTLESLGGWFIDSIDGDPSAVIGLSLPLLRTMLYELDYDVNQLWTQ